MTLMAKRYFRADILLAQNIRALLNSRGFDDKALAIWCGHQPAWVSKILAGERGIRVHELGHIADFFSLSVADLFLHGISQMNDRRRRERRNPSERRSSRDRRTPRGDIHPDVQMRFRQPQDTANDSPRPHKKEPPPE